MRIPRSTGPCLSLTDPELDAQVHLCLPSPIYEFRGELHQRPIELQYLRIGGLVIGLISIKMSLS